VIHLRVVAPKEDADRALALLREAEAAVNVARFEGAAVDPPGDVVLADVAREDASVILSDLRDLGIQHRGSLTLESIDTIVSDAADRAVKVAAGAPADAVVWEEVEEKTSEEAELSFSFLAFMAIAMVIASVGVLTDNPVLIVGAMVVGPEFGPIAGLCVAVIHKHWGLARRSLLAIGLGFPLGVAVTFLFSLLIRETGIGPESFDPGSHPLTRFISSPDAFSLIVAYLAGTVGVLSLTSAKSGALIGVLISVTTIPAAGNVGLAAAYGNWGEAGGALAQLSINLAAIVAAGLVTLYVQRRAYLLRKRRYRRGRERRAAGLEPERGAPVEPGKDAVRGAGDRGAGAQPR